MVNHLGSIISFTRKKKQMQKIPGNRLKESLICDSYSKNITPKILKKPTATSLPVDKGAPLPFMAA